MNKKVKTISRRSVGKVSAVRNKKRARFSWRRLLWHGLFVVFLLGVLSLGVRGLPGNPVPTQLNSTTWKEDGPLELSPERGRYVLLYSLAEDKSFHFSVDLARFAAPDVSYIDGNYVSVFAPAVSFLAIPGYLIGKSFGIAQVGSFATIGLFAILNVLLIRVIAVRLGAHPLAAILAGVTFLFGTPAFAYAVTLYQHHISVFLILLGVYLLIRFNNAFSLLGIWILCAFAFTIDYPNLFMMLPIGVVALFRLVLTEKVGSTYVYRLPVIRIVTLIGLIIPLVFLFWFNYHSYGKATTLSGGVERAVQIKSNGKPILDRDVYRAKIKAEKKKVEVKNTSFFGWFKNRNILNGFHVHFFSQDRGLIFYTPVMLFSLGGIYLALKKKIAYTGLLIGILGFNVILYSMWDDPYGGWAFGSRYLIPGYAVLSVFVAYMLTYIRKRNLWLLVFLTILAYSVSVNMLGAVTSNSNPPEVEARELSIKQQRDVPYTYLSNIQLLDRGISKSFVYQSYFKDYVNAWNYYMYLTVFILSVSALMVILLNANQGGKYDFV